MVQPNTRLEIIAPESVPLEDGRAIARVRVFLRAGGTRSPLSPDMKQSWVPLGEDPGPQPDNIAQLRTPGTVPRITFNRRGTFQYRVTVARGNWQDSQIFQIEVVDPRIPSPSEESTPRYRIEAPQQIRLPNPATARIVPAPPPDLHRLNWKKISGPGNVRLRPLRNATTAQRTIDFEVPGRYEFEVEIEDRQVLESPRFQVEVLPPLSQPPPEDGTPRYRIEAPQRVTLPDRAIVQILPLSSSAPPPETLEQSWRQVSGPSEAMIRNLRTPAAQPTIEFLVPGTYEFSVTLVDEGTPEAYRFQIAVEAAVTPPPDVDVGRDRTLNLPEVARLRAQVSDDGQPTSGNLEFRWRQTSPASPTVVFSNANAAETTAVFPDKGRYELRFTASDGTTTTSDTVTFRVYKAPVVEATAPGFAMLTDPVVLRGRVLDDGRADPSSDPLTPVWAKVSGPGEVTLVPSSEDGAIATARFAAPGLYTLRFVASNGQLAGSQDVTVGVSRLPLQVSITTARAIMLEEESLLQGSVTTDLPTDALTVLWEQVSGPGTLTFTNPNSLVTTMSSTRIGVYEVRLTVTAGAGGTTVSTTQQIVVNTTPVIDIEAPPVVMPDTPLTLQGRLLSDGLGDPETGRVTIFWQQISGSNLTIEGANSLTPSIHVPTEGDYVFELAVDNGFQTARSRILVIANQAPVVEAGTDQSLSQPGTLTLSGSVRDDHLPRGTLSAEWTMISGPSSVDITHPKALLTTAHFSVPGLYRLRLTVSDGATSASDDVLVTVNPSATPVTRGLVSLYTFEEGEGRVVRDRSTTGTPMHLQMTEADLKDIHWLPGGGLDIVGRVDLMTDGPATKLYNAVQQTHQFSVEVWFRPKSDHPLRGRGIPIRILSIAAEGEDAHTNRNFTLQQGQWRENDASFYHARLRTLAPATSDEEGVQTPKNTIPDEPVLNHIVYTWNGAGNARLYVDGALRQSQSFIAPSAGWERSLSNWDPHYSLAIANDPNGRWSGRGEFRRVAFYNQALTPDEVQRLYEAGLTG